jgi:hypothetical protein
MPDHRLSAAVQCGPSRFIREGDANGSKRYRVEADVQPYYGLRPRPGAVWAHQRGVCSSGESWESIEARNHYGAGIYGFEGRRSEYPYLTAEETAHA